jgi:CxxC motif-containing protein
MQSLYEINQEVESLIELNVDPETGVLTPEIEEKLDALEIQREQKIVSTGLYIKNLQAFLNQIKEEKKRLTEMQKSAENRITRIKEYLQNNLEPDEKITTAQVNINWRKSASVEVDPAIDIEQIEVAYPELVRIKKELNKTAAKNLLKSGDIGIAGIKIVEKKNIVIK